MSALGRGLAAGAAGTAALNAVTYADMAWRARPASSVPTKAVETMAGKAGQSIPGEGDERTNRLEGLGALSGIATGVGIGAAAGVLAPLIARVPTLVGSVMVGAGAMAATDLPMARLGITDPTTWSGADWLSDVVPHLAYGFVTVVTLRALRSG